MKKFKGIMRAAALIALLSVILPGLCLAAGAVLRGPQRETVTVRLGAGEVTLVGAGGTARADVETVFFAQAAAGTTQTVSFVIGAVTNTAFTKVVAATDRLATASNMPTLFGGDKLLITSSSAAGTNAAYVVWHLTD